MERNSRGQCKYSLNEFLYIFDGLGYHRDHKDLFAPRSENVRKGEETVSQLGRKIKRENVMEGNDYMWQSGKNISNACSLAWIFRRMKVNIWKCWYVARHQRRSGIISAVELRLSEAKGQKLFLVQIRISPGPRQAFFGLETEHFGKIPCVFVDHILDELNGLFDFHLDLRLLLNFQLNFRPFLLFFPLLLLLFAGIEVVAPLMCLFLPFLLDDLAFFSQLFLAFAVEESLHDIESLMKNLIQRR